MSKKNHKEDATNLIKGLINSEDTTPQQQVVIQPVIEKKAKETVEKTTIDIETELLTRAKMYGVKNKKTLRSMVEQALREFLEKYDS
ncbi:hypothetical protein QM480_24695 [Flectobacillus sp. DC10W]|uniref:CopG family transcriptional regulator n=1 Tax=Flectobacillus longus TaxID=2984207 RepID=A0ABT6YVU0_9BACT|nr:hypothetical protein [Flectobacillus longus]MDI9867567.1 hypothetical protein [Flectobacillus longus]